MTAWYLDTSAALKLLVDEKESDSLVTILDTTDPDLVACHLLETELRRAVQRFDGLTHDAVTRVIDGVDLYDVPASLFREAGYLAGANLRSLDALHLASAIRIGADAILTYDQRLTDASRDLGIDVVAPGIPSTS